MKTPHDIASSFGRGNDFGFAKDRASMAKGGLR